MKQLAKNIGFVLITVLSFTAISCHKEAKLDTDMEENFYFRNGAADMPVYVRGNGASKVFVLVLHGGPGDGGYKYANHTYSNALEEKYAMVYWDQRIQGNSHGHIKEDVTIDMMVEDTYNLLKTLKARYGEDISLFLFGHSWGGTLGTSFMVKNDYQYMVNGWIESGGAHDFPFMNKALVTKLKTTSAEEISAGRNVDKWTEIYLYTLGLDTNNISWEETSKLNGYAGIAESLIPNLPQRTSSELSDIQRLFTGPDNPTTTNINALQLPSALFEEIITLSLNEQLNKIQTPTLLLWGEYDFKVPKALGEFAFENINTTEKFLNVYPNSGHSSMRYEPEAFVADVVQFIETYK